MNMYTNNDPRKSNHKKPGSEQNKEHMYYNNIAKTMTIRQYVTEEIIIRITTSNVHNISNNICLQTVLSAINNKRTQTCPFQKTYQRPIYQGIYKIHLQKNNLP